MKRKLLYFLIVGVFVIGACAPAAVEEAVAPEVVEEVMEEEPAAEAPAMEEAAPTEEGAMAAEVSFSADLVPVLEEWAYPAHSTQGRGGVFLATYDDVMEYVIPGNPEESMFYRRLIGDGVPIMPPSGKLPDETIQLFYDWIMQGAKNN
ncbi:MAG: hypothetical protein FJZ98_09650 [Chloroflexi bacterium]|nr:hypothetical protein [Chloroflexota bacterium]